MEFYLWVVLASIWTIRPNCLAPRVMQAQHGRQISQIPYFTCQRHEQEIPVNCAFKKCWKYLEARKKIEIVGHKSWAGHVPLSPMISSKVHCSPL